MKTMKMNFKYVMMAAALSMGLASCSNDNGDEVVPPVNASEHSVKVKINVGAATRTEEAGTAVGITPTLTDLTLFFVDKTKEIVTKVYLADVNIIDTPSGETVEDIPGGSNAIYAIGNLTKVTSGSILAINESSTEADLKAALIDVEKQRSAGTPSYNDVNLYGYNTYIVSSDKANASLSIHPAISRLEIAKIEANQNPDVATDKIEAFNLDGIFINNTYKKIGVDPAIYGEALGYAGNNSIWTADIATYPEAFRDYFNPAKSGYIAYTPAASSKWAYYVAPAAKPKSGGGYEGELIGSTQYGAVPVIVVKISNITYNATYTDMPDPAYITVTKLNAGGVSLDHFERGNVYDITSIAFDASNLTEEPMTPPAHDATVDVTVKPWEGVPTTPEL